MSRVLGVLTGNTVSVLLSSIVILSLLACTESSPAPATDAATNSAVDGDAAPDSGADAGRVEVESVLLRVQANAGGWPPPHAEWHGVVNGGRVRLRLDAMDTFVASADLEGPYTGQRLRFRKGAARQDLLDEVGDWLAREADKIEFGTEYQWLCQTSDTGQDELGVVVAGEVTSFSLDGDFAGCPNTDPLVRSLASIAVRVQTAIDTLDPVIPEAVELHRWPEGGNSMEPVEWPFGADVPLADIPAAPDGSRSPGSETFRVTDPNLAAAIWQFANEHERRSTGGIQVRNGDLVDHLLVRSIDPSYKWPDES